VALSEIELYHPACAMTEARDAAAAANFSAAAVYVDQNEHDKLLVSRCLAGDETAFEGLVERYQRVLFTVAVRMVGDREEAADATQNAFVKAYRKLDTFDPAGKFFSWIYRILFNECLNIRRNRRGNERFTPEPAPVASPADLLDAAERRARVQAAILALPPLYREVIVLRFFGELSYEEIADSIGTPVKTVKSRLHTARERLASLLNLEAKS
jgi:RNA polymerase sigma-70 factor, ECF subfamily